jgi:hypothetical protein
LSAYSIKKVAEAATTAFGRHSRYLSELLVDFRFFDDNVPAEKESLVVTALSERKDQTSA